MISDMETNHTIDVMNLDAMHRRALEDVIGVQLQANQRLVIGVTEIEEVTPPALSKRPQTLEDWARVYEGLTDEQIDEIDRIANTRADLTRDVS
jgi:hypothetical protein